MRWSSEVALVVSGAVAPSAGGQGHLRADLAAARRALRLAAARSLEKFGNPAIPYLKKALKHQDPEVSVSAKLILAKIASKAKKPAPPRLPDGCPGCGLG